MTGEHVAREAPFAAAPARDGQSLRDWVQEVSALTRRWWLLFRRERLEMLFSVLQPAIWLVFFGSGVERTVDKSVIGTDDYIAFMLAGVISFTVVGSGVTAAMPLLWDKETGYLDRLMSMPIARSSVIVSRFVFQTGLISAQIVLVLLVALAMGVDFQTGFPGVLVLVVTAALLTLAVTAAFLGLAYKAPGHGTFFAITGFVSLPLLFMSNAFVPLDKMPVWMEVVARVNPLTYAIGAMRTLVVTGWEPEIARDMAILAGLAAVCLAVGASQFRRQTGDRAE
jgi:ABC-2 type transport system permease protein